MAPDNPDRAEGVAGVTWATKRIIERYGLPDCAIGQPAQIEKYSTEAFVSKGYVEQRLKAGKLLPKALLGIPVTVKGKVWGCVILDSRRADGFKTFNDVTGEIAMAQLMLETLLGQA